MRFVLLLGSVLWAACSPAQQPLTVRVEALNWDSMPGLQSFAAGQYNGYWLLIGGRTDGLHMKQPFASFHPDYNNTRIYLIHPATRKVQSAPLSSLPAPVAEQLQSSNMEFVQVGDHLYLFGGYGFSASQNKFITHPRVPWYSCRSSC
ncbi:MAG TPA: hypothetical protein PKE63_05415, partial [Lacibacter sp.]|nr:hypothetical protein [Lacibacter sp.]